MESCRFKFVSNCLDDFLYMEYDITILQDLYFQTFPNDKPQLKCLVFGVYILEMVQTFMLTQTVWNTHVENFGNIADLDEIGTSWFSVCFIGGLGKFSDFSCSRGYY